MCVLCYLLLNLCIFVSRMSRRRNLVRIVSDFAQPSSLGIPENLIEIVEENWHSIRSSTLAPQSIRSLHNFRILGRSPSDVINDLQDIFVSQQYGFRINYALGFLLDNVDTSELRYYHASENAGVMLDTPKMIANRSDFDQFVDDIDLAAGFESARFQRDDTKFAVSEDGTLASNLPKQRMRETLTQVDPHVLNQAKTLKELQSGKKVKSKDDDIDLDMDFLDDDLGLSDE